MGPNTYGEFGQGVNLKIAKIFQENANVFRRKLAKIVITKIVIAKIVIITLAQSFSPNSARDGRQTCRPSRAELGLTY
jgi:hypothetical protein